jgi:hypothetical protein
MATAAVSPAAITVNVPVAEQLRQRQSPLGKFTVSDGVTARRRSTGSDWAIGPFGIMVDSLGYETKTVAA